MGFVLKADGALADAWVEKGFSAQTDMWVTLDLRFDAALIASEDPIDLGYGPNFFQLQKTAAGDDQGAMTNPDGAGGVGLALTYQSPFVTLGAPLAADAFHTVELHVVGGTPHSAHLYVDGTDLGALSTAHDVASWDGIHVGIFFVAPDSRQVYLIDNVKIGTSRGASDVFGDDFETGDLSAWDASSGAVSVIGGGGPTVASFSPASGVAVDSVTVTGTGFTGATSVEFAGTPAASFVVNSDVQIVAVVPAGAVSGRITVMTPSGTGTSSTDFAITPLNTACADALAITGTTGSYDADNRGVDGNWVAPDPLWNVQDNRGTDVPVGGGAPLWWKFTNVYGRPVVLKVFIDPFDPLTDATNLILGIFEGPCGAFDPDPENPMAFGVPGGTGDNWKFVDVTNSQSVLLAVRPGATVYLEIDGYSGDTANPPTLPPEGSLDEAEYNGRGTWTLSWEVRDATLQDDWNYVDSHEEATSEDSHAGSGQVGAMDYVEFDGASWYLSGHDPDVLRVVRWDGAAATPYVLPTAGSIWEDRWSQLATDGESLWAIYLEKLFVTSPEGGAWDPARVAIDVWSGSGFERLDTIEAAGYNTATVTSFGDPSYAGGVGGLETSADPSMPGRLYVVWSECGYGASVIQPDLTHGYEFDLWHERMVVACYGDDAPFSVIEWRSSTEPFADYKANGFAATSCCVAPFRAWLTTDDGNCRLWLNPPRQESGRFSEFGTYYAPRVETWTVNDDATLDYAYEIGFIDGLGLIPDPDPATTYVERGFAVEPACADHPSIGAAGEVWAFVRQGDAFPGNHPDYSTLGGLGVTGVLWRDTDPAASDGVASTRTAGFRAGIWTVSGSGQSAASFATQASNCVTDFAPDLLVLDVETEYGDDTTPEWDWHDDMMVAYRLLQPIQATAVSMGPLKDDFNYSAYTSRGCEVWPQSYPADIADCGDWDPIEVSDRVVANGVDASLVVPVIAAPCYPAQVAELVAAGRHAWALFTIDDSPAAPDATASGVTVPKRTVIVGWKSGASSRTQVYLVRCDLQGAAEWYDTPPKSNLGTDPTIYNGQWSKAIYTDRYRQTWWAPRVGPLPYFGQVTTYVFDRKCLNDWIFLEVPRIDGLPTGQDRARVSRQWVWDEPADIVRWGSYKIDPPPPSAGATVSYVETALVSRKGALCLVGGLTVTSTAPYIDVQFRAEASSATPASIGDAAAAHLSGASFRAFRSGADPADTATTPPLYVSRDFRAG